MKNTDINMENLKQFIEKAKCIIYFTSNQALIFDNNNNQIPELQALFRGKTDTKLLLQIAENCEYFFIAKWKEWRNELTKDEFINLLHLK